MSEEVPMIVKDGSGWTREQAIAAGGMMLLTIGVGASLWYHLTNTAGALHIEFVLLIVMLALLMPMSVLYALRIRWSYPAGVLVCLGFYIGLFMAWLEDVLFFAPTLYNVLVMLALLIALGVIICSIRIVCQQPPRRWWHAGLGVLGVAIVAFGVVQVANANAGRITEWNARLVMSRLRQDLAALDTVEEKIRHVMAEGDLAGASVGIVVDDQLVWTGAFGEGITEETLFNVGSIAKPVTASAVLQLVERGLIDLEADISDYLPFKVRHPDYPDVPVTTRMLLMHKSCMAHHTPTYAAHMGRDTYLEWDAGKRGRSLYGEIVLPEGDPNYGTFVEGYLDPDGAYYAPDAWLDCRPGMEYSYSSPGYDLLGYLVEQVSGRSFDEYLQAEIFQPLGMTHTARLSEDPPYPQATPIERVFGVVSKANLEAPIYGAARVGGGGLYSTVPDMAQFVIAHLNQGQVGDVQLLEPETVAEMHKPQVYSKVDLGMEAYGYGWTRYQQAPWQFWGTFFQFFGAGGHGGGDIGYRTRIYAVEKGEGGFGVIVLTNTENFFKPDDLWLFSTYLQLETLLMEQAQRLWALEHGN
jgi:CubicO group peptidase (beta-lactamase class C family)